MERRFFIQSTSLVTSATVLTPSLILAAENAAESITKHSQEFIEYTSETVNKLNDYEFGVLFHQMIL